MDTLDTPGQALVLKHQPRTNPQLLAAVPWFFLILILACLSFPGWRAYVPFGSDDGWLLADWLLLMLVSVLAVCVIGTRAAGRAAAVLIDGRNKMSLSRLQTFAWTIVIFPALGLAMAARVFDGASHPLAVGIPSQVWLALGISLTSLAGTPLIMNMKEHQTAGDEQATRMLGPLPTADPPAMRAIGNAMVKDNVCEASWTDIFRGDEMGNRATVDISKVQMFYLSLVLIGAYAFEIGKLFLSYSSTGVNGLQQFPDFDSSAVGLLAVSHAGYLGYKAAPHSAPP